MAHRGESRLATVTLGLILGLVLLFGCRAFDPEPVIVNRAPDTFITGAPAETTGTVFRRHVYWYGNDNDGQVVRFIYAITDSTVRDQGEPDTDEEDQRFDPADDITTLEIIPGRVVGYTTETDSIFEFTIDRDANTSKDITFHIVSVDDRGDMDDTPARLHFFNNSLGNPVLRFTVSTFDDQGNETVRWIGSVRNGPKLPGDVLWPWDPDPTAISPEDSEFPQIGFLNPFRICWEASSPNGDVTGYRYRASELQRSTSLPIEFNPETGQFEEGWSLDTTCFDYANNVAPEDIPNLPPEDCPSGWLDCPEQLRWSSGPHRLQVGAIDIAVVTSVPLDGELRYNMNYPPETWLVDDAEWPKYIDGGQEFKFVQGDTVPEGAWVVFKQRGLDRLERNINDVPPPCCDEIFNSCVLTGDCPEVRYQTKIDDARAQTDQGGNAFWSTFFSLAAEEDTLGFFVGPFDYTMLFRCQDEHDTPDNSPVQFQFVGGFNPSITDLQPTDNDSLLARNPAQSVFGQWPGNTVPHQIESQTTTKFWDGTSMREDPCGGCLPVTGNNMRYKVEFTGAADPREASSAIRAWSYNLFSSLDPGNFIKDGAGRDDIDFFDRSPDPNHWLMSEQPGGDGPTTFIPSLLWSNPDLFSPGAAFADQGEWVAKRIGDMTLEVRGKTAAPGDKHVYYPFDVRPCATCSFREYDLTQLGRRTVIESRFFFIYLGLDPNNTGSIAALWPVDFFNP